MLGDRRRLHTSFGLPKEGWVALRGWERIPLRRPSEAVYCAPVLKAHKAATLRCLKTPSGRRQKTPLAQRSEFLPSRYVHQTQTWRDA
jgi:hypothetical protein